MGKRALFDEPTLLAYLFWLVASHVTKFARSADQFSLTRFLFFNWLRFVGFLFDDLHGEFCGLFRRFFAGAAGALCSRKGLFYKLADGVGDCRDRRLAPPPRPDCRSRSLC